MPNYKDNYITPDEYIVLQQLGLTYEGFVKGVGYAYTLDISITPPHMDIYNPPRFAPPGMGHYIHGTVQCMESSKYTITRSYNITTEEIMDAITTIDNSNQTITVNMGNGQYMTLPQANSNINVTINDNLEELSLIVSATNTLTQESRETRSKLADFSAIFSNYGGEGILRGEDAESGISYYEASMFYTNLGIGVTSTGATIKGGYHLSNELYHFTRSSRNLHFIGSKYWNNPFVNNSKAALAARGGVWRNAGTKLGYVGIAITAGDALMSGEFKTSQGINIAMTTLAIAVPGVGSIIAGVYFIADIGLTLSTGQGIGDRIDAATGGTHELYNGLY